MFFSKCSQMSPRSAKRCVLLIWIMSVIVSLPHGLFHNTYEFPDDDGKTIVQCLPVHPDAGWWKTYNVYLVIIQYFVPMVILDTAYTMIAVKIWTLSKARIEMDETKMANQKVSFDIKLV
uniref:G_PROTEIN_RECEP_F1_2 domain-containing protein n=1 Tax=Caenorhabditis tropicalis TaxID=1561998 RepID=A0A1I7U1P5_9PELO